MLKNIILYLMQRSNASLNKARMTKLVYLLDWKACLETWNQATELKWYFDHYGPFITDIDDEICANQEIFSITYLPNSYNPSSFRPVTIYKAKTNVTPELPDFIKASADFIIEKTDWLDFDSFINFVYSTYPVIATDKYSHLNLVALAREYKKQKDYSSL